MNIIISLLIWGLVLFVVLPLFAKIIGVIGDSKDAIISILLPDRLSNCFIALWFFLQLIDLGLGLLCYFLVSIQTFVSGSTHSVCLAVHPFLRTGPLSWLIYAFIAADWGVPILAGIFCFFGFIVMCFRKELYCLLLFLPVVPLVIGGLLGLDLILTNIPVYWLYSQPRWSIIDSGDSFTVFHSKQSEQYPKNWESFKYKIKKGYPEQAEHQFPILGLNKIELQREVLPEKVSKQSKKDVQMVSFVFRFFYNNMTKESWILKIYERDSAVFQDHLRRSIITFAERAQVKAEIVW
jgi:hypothetical protein